MPDSQRLRIAGVVVAYHPDELLITRIPTYLPYLRELLIVDNSDSVTTAVQAFAERTDNVTYRFMGANVGVARALNMGAEHALAHPCDFLLTMDQDSSFTEPAIRRLVSVASSAALDTVGIISPAHSFRSTSTPLASADAVQEVLFCMTSGNLVNLRAYRQVGGFMDALFIDHVDHEYGMRLNLHGYKVWQVNDAVLHHQLGVSRTVTMAGVKLVTFVSHSPIRGYYMIRNGLYVSKRYQKKYPQFVRQTSQLIAKEVIKCVFWEKEKRYRLRLMYRGYTDFRSNRLGPFTNP